MPSGPKKRKAAKRKKEVLHIHVDNESLESIPSPGNASESGGDTPSPMGPDNGEVEAVEVTEACRSGGEVGSDNASENGGHISASAEEQGVKTQNEEEVFDAPYEACKVESSVFAPKAKDEVIDDMTTGEDGFIGDYGASSVNETRKVVYAAEPSCIIKQVVSVTEEMKSSEVLIEKIGEFPSVVDKAPIEEVGNHASTMEDSVLARGKEEDVILFGGALADEPATGSTERQLDVASQETQNVVRPSQVVRKTSWMSCCGLFDIFSGSTR